MHFRKIISIARMGWGFFFCNRFFPKAGKLTSKTESHLKKGNGSGMNWQNFPLLWPCKLHIIMHDTAGIFPRSSRYVHPLISFTGLNLVFHINYCSFIEWKACIFNCELTCWLVVKASTPNWSIWATWVSSTVFEFFSLQHFKLWSLQRRKSDRER